MLDLSGKWTVILPEEGGQDYRETVSIPGTLDTNGIGGPDGEKLNNRLTRLHTWEGEARYETEVILSESMRGKRLFLMVERSRKLALRVNRESVEKLCGTLSTPWIFELTGMEKEGKLSLSITCDNHYNGWPRKAILNSSAATDETQTNWNGLLGKVQIVEEEKNFIEAIRIYPKGNRAEVYVQLNLGQCFSGAVTAVSEAFAEPFSQRAEGLQPGRHSLYMGSVRLKEEAERWDEEEGRLYTVQVQADGMREKETAFGIRDFGENENHRLTLNGRVFFLRGEANCAVFPETGHPPMDLEAWKRILSVYASYGVNCVRFHSWCPPEAAFYAADQMGMMMQPELSNWNYEDAFETEEDYAYYREELTEIIRMLANHPSFVMLSFGNELWAEALGHERMDELLDLAHALDNTRLYANSSNPHYGMRGTDRKSDFYTSHNYRSYLIRGSGANMEGHINQAYPNARTNFSEGVRIARDEYGHPVFSFEVGQFEVLPDFSEISSFQGVTRAVNLELVREEAAKRGYLEEWPRWVEASGENALAAYREEVESALRTGELSGLSLLGLQDFPGQGTALVGMLNSHLQPKPFSFAQPERFRRFFAPVVLLAYLEKYTYVSDELLRVPIRLANYGKKEVRGCLFWKLLNGKHTVCQGSFPKGLYENQGLSDVGTLEIPLNGIDAPAALTLELALEKVETSYPLCVYPSREQSSKKAGDVLTADSLDEEVLRFLRKGGRVFLDPPAKKEYFPASIGGQFTTDFWSVGSFPEQEGGMGMVIDASHPALEHFPTAFYSQWQWWPMANGRPMILPEWIRPIIRVPDSCLRMKPMGLLFEAKIGAGRLMVSSMGLHDIQQYPEAGALLDGILTYMNGPGFQPVQELTEEQLKEIVSAGPKKPTGE